MLTLTAEKLYETIEDYPDIEILIHGEWFELTNISNYHIVKGSWLSDGLHIFIECGETEHTFQLMDQITIREIGE